MNVQGRGIQSQLGQFNRSLRSCNVDMDEIYIIFRQTKLRFIVDITIPDPTWYQNFNQARI